MAFAVFLHPKAAKALEKIEKSVSLRIKEKLANLKEDPEIGKPLKYTNFYSLRISDYRAIYEIEREKNRVVILFIGHRKKVYDDFSKIF
ncbi:MAG: type II toxin-antitoxin system RelE/ParE family toxin [Methanocellales archaeon]